MDTSRSAPLTPGGSVGRPGADATAGVTALYRSYGFAALPALPGSAPVPAGVLAGTFAW